MKVAVLGHDGPLARATREELVRRGHTLGALPAQCVIYFPAAHAVSRAAKQAVAELKNVVAAGGYERIILRSHALAYGAHPKNPGSISEERISLLPDNAPEQRWLKLERAVSQAPNWAAVRLTNVLAEQEGDLLVRQLMGRAAAPVAGRDPQVQFVSVRDAARALAAAAESRAPGIFNAAAEGALPLKRALQAAGTTRIPLPRNLQKLFRGGDGVGQLEFNWTISAERAARELGFRPEQTTTEALAQFLAGKPGSHTKELQKNVDLWGLDEDYIRTWGLWFAFLRKVYWRIDSEGLNNIPSAGRGVFVSNHRGFMPLDAVMHLSLVLNERRRLIRFLIIPCLLYFPFLANFLTKLGGVIASQENAERLFNGENLVGIFPEGIRGTFLPYKSTYQLRDFSKSAFAQLAIANQAPIIPAAVIGHAEIFPIIGKIDSKYLRRKTGWPYFPIAPPFPLLPFVPLPTKWHVRVLEPVSIAGLSPADAHNERITAELSRHVQDLVQRNIDQMRSRRKHIFWGRVLDGTAPPRRPFEPAATRMESRA